MSLKSLILRWFGGETEQERRERIAFAYAVGTPDADNASWKEIAAACGRVSPICHYVQRTRLSETGELEWSREISRSEFHSRLAFMLDMLTDKNEILGYAIPTALGLRGMPGEMLQPTIALRENADLLWEQYCELRPQ